MTNEATLILILYFFYLYLDRHVLRSTSYGVQNFLLIRFTREPRQLMTLIIGVKFELLNFISKDTLSINCVKRFSSFYRHYSKLVFKYNVC